MSKENLDAFKFDQTKTTIDASKKVRVGIVGTGWIAEAHMDNYLAQPDVEIVAGCDLVPGKAEAFMKKFGIENAKTYLSCKEMVAHQNELKLDAVSICTYNRQHVPCAIDCLNAGIHVLLEKPMCVDMDEATDLLRAERKSGKILSIGFQPRFDENMKMVKRVVQSGVLGQIYYIQTGGGRRRGIPTPFGTTFIREDTAGLGALADIGCYSLDMVLNAIGYPKPLTVTGYKSDFFGKMPEMYGSHPEYAKEFGVDDFAAAFIRLEGGIILDFRIAWAMNFDTSGDTLIWGTKGGLRIPSTECWNGSIGGPLKIYHDVAGEQVVTEIPDHKSGPDDPSPFFYKIRCFLDAVKNGGCAPVPTSQIIYNQAILSGIAESARVGHEIEIQIPEI